MTAQTPGCGPNSEARKRAAEGALPKALFIAIGTRALEKHQDSCEVCSDDHSCAVANAHLRSLDRLRTPPERRPS